MCIMLAFGWVLVLFKTVLSSACMWKAAGLYSPYCSMATSLARGCSGLWLCFGPRTWLCTMYGGIMLGLQGIWADKVFLSGMWPSVLAAIAHRSSEVSCFTIRGPSSSWSSLGIHKDSVPAIVFLDGCWEMFLLKCFATYKLVLYILLIMIRNKWVCLLFGMLVYFSQSWCTIWCVLRRAYC